MNITNEIIQVANHKQEQLEAAMEILYRLSGFRRSLPTRNKIAYGSHVCKLDRLSPLSF
jgi:hypothetical protein